VNLPRRVLVVGLARSGEAAVLALARRGVEVVAADRSPDVETGRLVYAGVEVHLGTEEDRLLQGVELVVKSPGVPGESPLPAAARAHGVPIWSEVELGWQLLGRPPLIGVTGTNGKTTTAELLGAIFHAAGRPVEVAGNVGRPLTALDGALAPGAWIVCELSSFQLEDVHELACDVAVLINLEPDHLDRHGTFDAYRDAKLRIFERARIKIVPRGLGLDGVEFGPDDLLPAEPLIPGLHNRENAAAATAAARAAGIDDDAIAEALRTFPGVPHRLELVAEIDGVRYVNDSKATNTAAARRGIAAYALEPLRLILGGSLKGESFAELALALPETVRSIDLIGDATEELVVALDFAGRRYRRAGDLGTALALISAEAERGDVVLLSPACASYDQYRNFEERGDHFRRLVESLR
jgi:UDP-N-acetylmuramoylalanine--D-glutamate ligase